MSTWLVDRVSSALDRATSRRGFLFRAALVGSALTVDPIDYVLRPGTAYGTVCTCGDPTCSCSSACCDGYTEFCCTIHGSNACPPGTVAGGWWRADGSNLCGGGPRYYIDCHGQCSTDNGPSVPGHPDMCTDDGLTCGCADQNCDNRVAGCVTFRYGQCHQEIRRMGRIACRVVTCTPAYTLDNACTNDALYDEATASHNAPCLEGPPFIRRAYGTAVQSTGEGMWMADPQGVVYTWGSAGHYGALGDQQLKAPVVGISAPPDGRGYWMVAADGGVFAFGSAPFRGSLGDLSLNAPIVGLAGSPTGRGYWLVASDGGVFAFGDASFHGSCGNLSLQQPIVGMTPTATGDGYWLVASDGGVFAFGGATFHGSDGGRALTSFIAGLAPTATGKGYWLWGQDGTVHPFGDAQDLGDYQPKGDLPSHGVDAFYAFAAIGSGYSLWALSPLGPPPDARRYDFSPAAPPPSPTSTLLPPLPSLPPLPPL